MSEMVEHVARAIWLQRCRNVGADPTEGFTSMAFDKQSLGRQSEVMQEARAAIEAMRGSTVEMADIGAGVYERVNLTMSAFQSVSDAYDAMIDEALK